MAVFARYKLCISLQSLKRQSKVIQYDSSIPMSLVISVLSVSISCLLAEIHTELRQTAALEQKFVSIPTRVRQTILPITATDVNPHLMNVFH